MRKNPSSSFLNAAIGVVLATCVVSISNAAIGSERIKFASLGDLWYACGEEERLQDNEYANPNSLGYARGFCDGIISLVIDAHEPWCVPSGKDVKVFLKKKIAELTEKERMEALVANEPPTVFLHKTLTEGFPCN